jgi:hypothetical protein
MTKPKKYGFSWSWKRASGLSGLRQAFSRKTGVPTTRYGLERKTGSLLLEILFGKKKRK